MDTVLIVDDEECIRHELAAIIEEKGRRLLSAGNGAEALEQLGSEKVDVVLTDIRMPVMDGFDLIKKTRQQWPSIPIITITAFASTETAVQALRAGAYDYVTKPFSIDEIRNVVSHALQGRRLFKEVNYLRGRLAQRYSLDNIIGQCPAMQRVFDTISLVASAPCNILITGESGTGKDIVAQAIHEHSPRNKGRFVPINCGSIPEGLLESELFGHVKGSFSGAVSHKEGLIQTANGGTVFLDEIGDMPLALQAKLLRLIQNKQVQKVGSTRQESVDVRIIAATNKKLDIQIAEKAFRKDLYYRINVVELALPPLRNRGGDICLLASHFLSCYSNLLSRKVNKFNPEVTKAFHRYPWPGNVRELENAVERAVTFCTSRIIELEHLPRAITDYLEDRMANGGLLQDRLANFEVNCLKAAMEANDHDLALTAKALGISLATLYRKMKKLNIHPGRRITAIAPESKSNQQLQHYP